MPVRDYFSNEKNRIRPATEAFEGSVPTAEGMQVKAVDQLTELRRYLVLGVYSNFYHDQGEIIKKFESLVTDLLETRDYRMICSAIEMAQEIYDNSYYLDLDTVLYFFVLVSQSRIYKQYTFAFIPKLRNGSHFLLFMKLLDMKRGWGRGIRASVQEWYERQGTGIYWQLMKYSKRWGISHKDVVFKAHPKLDAQVFNTIMGNADVPDLVQAVQEAQNVNTEQARVIELIRQFSLTHEMVNPVHLSKKVWQILIEESPNFHAVLWNLGKWTAQEVLSKDIKQQVLTAIQRGTRHMNVFDYIKAYYRYGNGFGKNFRWEPDREILRTLEQSFLNAVENLNFQVDARVTYAVDISGSMTWGAFSSQPTKFGVSASTAAATVLYTLLRTTPDHRVLSFDTEAQPFPVTAGMNLTEIRNLCERANGGGTDHSSVIRYLLKNNVDTDVLVFLTDNEQTTGYNMGDMIKRYEQQVGHKVKVINIAMVPANFTAAYADHGVFEIAGFDDFKLWEMALDMA